MIPSLGNSHEKQGYRDTKQMGGFWAGSGNEDWR